MTDDPVLKVLHQFTKAAPASSERPRVAPPFAAKGELPLAALTVEVTGVGVLSPALSDEQAQTLHAVSTPAPRGQRERTVLDTRVRHTGEIAAQQVALHWAAGAFDALQAQAAQGQGLNRVEARLHSLLV